jgi:hypothetical protein
LVRHLPKVVPTRVRGRSGHQIPFDQAQGNGDRPKPVTAVRVQCYLNCSGSVQWRLAIALWTARTGFFVLYPVFKEHLETRSLPAHAGHAGRIPCDGGGALNPLQWFDPIGPATGRAPTIRRRNLPVKGDPASCEQGNTISRSRVPQPARVAFC